MTSRPDDCEILQRNVFMLLSCGTLIWYCEECSFESHNSLVAAGMHMRDQHPAKTREINAVYTATYL